MALKSKIQELGQQLVLALSGSEAVRLGESTVISRRVHVMSVDKPEEVKIIGADAGQLFYGRSKKGTIYHVDIFHEVGRVDHRELAQVIIEVAGSQLTAADKSILDHMDIQTATGGGRITGSLAFGRKASLRRAHANHVHLAAELGSDELPLLVSVVAAAEKEILRQGLEIRKVERVSLDLREQRSGKADLSAYTSESDTFLREEGTSANKKCTDAGTDMEEARRLVAETLPPKELLQLLQLFPLEPKSEHRERWGDLDNTLEALRSKGYAERRRGLWKLTVKGQALHEMINLNLPELESCLRRFLRRFAISGSYSRSMVSAVSAKPGIGLRQLREKPEVTYYNCGGELNLAATAAQAACRWIRGQSPVGCIDRETWRYGQPLRRQTVNVVLLLDCSASMTGDRLRAARLLAQHLVLSTRDKVAVIAFQDEKVLVPPKFSNSLAKIQAQLLALRAVGLTPLAQAFRETRLFLQQNRVHKPLVVLITDGIPTVPLTGGDPSFDALSEGAKFKLLPLEFVCIGLNPNQSFLEELSRRSSGRLYIVKELETSVLAQLVHQELQRYRN